MSTVRLEPVRDLVVVVPEPPKGLQSALLQVVEFHEKAAFRGVVESVGPEVRDVRPGQRVLFSRLQGYEVLGRFVMAESAILATV